MWEKVSKEELKKARESVDPTLPHLVINEATGGEVSYEQLLKGLTLSSERDDKRIKGARIRAFFAGPGGGFSQVVEAVETAKIEIDVPKEKSREFSGQKMEVWYYVIEFHTGNEEWTASEREHYSMGSPT